MDASADPPRWGAASDVDALEWRSRWRGEPPAEAYSRVSDAERYRVLHAFASAVVDDLEREFAVERQELDGLAGGTADHVEFDRVLRLVPGDPAAAPLVVGLTRFPGVLLRFGEQTDVVLPHCGCDACDELVQDLRDEARFHIDALVLGGFAEGVSADGAQWHRFVTSRGSMSGTTPADGARAPGVARTSGVARTRDWRAWRHR